MPAGAYRDFVAWAFSARNPRQQEFLQATGVVQLINMNTTLFSGLVSEERWPAMLRYASVMNAYQVLEVISDNLAIGLGRRTLDAQDLQRRALVTSVNRAMIETLTPGRRTPAVLLLAGQARLAAQQTSGFAQSLAAEKHAGAAQEYALFLEAQGKPSPPLDELEYGLWPALVANVETCRELLETMAGTATLSLLRQGLTDRYQAVDRTLYAEYVSRLELASLGAQTILVAPTLAFLLGALAEKVHMLSGYQENIKNGLVPDVLADAALLVRLQNDIGTRLLRMASPHQSAALQRVRGSDGTGGIDLLLHHGDDPTFTRLHKDLVNGESNVALWHARRAGEGEEQWLALADSLAYYAGLYAQHSARLTAGLAALDERMGDRRVSTAIERLVRFHERMYAHRHTDTFGEYAI